MDEMAELDLESRQLCSDGSCTGVLDAEGRCKVCGQGSSALEISDPAPESDEAFDQDRQLCPDGSCIGVIGADGRCRQCHRSVEAPSLQLS